MRRILLFLGAIVIVVGIVMTILLWNRGLILLGCLVIFAGSLLVNAARRMKGPL